jgi:AAA domain
MTWFTRHDLTPGERAALDALERPSNPAVPPGTNGRAAKMMARTVTRNGGNVNDESGLTIRKANIDRAHPFQWAWEQRILLSYLNLLIGEEGVGKGNLVAWIAANITRGALPGNLHHPRKVVIIGDEDSFDHIWVPRLKVADADLNLVEHIVAGSDGVLDVKEDAEALRKYIERERTALVYFDQLLDNLGFTDSWKDKQVRDALAPLRAVAQRTKVAILASMHPNKRGGSFRDRISGTPAFNALSRSSLLAASHPNDPGRTVLVRGKGNYSAEPPAFEFRIEPQELTLGQGKKQRIVKTSRITDVRETELRRDELLEDRSSRRREESRAGQARRLLRDMFADGKERPAAEVQNALHSEHGLKARTVSDAATELGFKKRQQGFPAEWYWRPGV